MLHIYISSHPLPLGAAWNYDSRCVKPLPAMPLKEVWLLSFLSRRVSKETVVEAAKFFWRHFFAMFFVVPFLDLLNPMIKAENWCFFRFSPHRGKLRNLGGENQNDMTYSPSPRLHSVLGVSYSDLDLCGWIGTKVIGREDVFFYRSIPSQKQWTLKIEANGISNVKPSWWSLVVPTYSTVWCLRWLVS